MRSMKRCHVERQAAALSRRAGSQEHLLMLLSIPEPAKYFCEADEEHFFGWLQGLPAVKAVAGTPT